MHSIPIKENRPLGRRYALLIDALQDNILSSDDELAKQVKNALDRVIIMGQSLFTFDVGTWIIFRLVVHDYDISAHHHIQCRNLDHIRTRSIQDVTS